ncbi:hypothetical protein F4781DRAFT_439301 [Annulohypoxylon bovei var. microspora]|nr:hypothetical protein F4781DRAFT_439301 [Annulohypoxylon bovei var. microspora]
MRRARSYGRSVVIPDNATIRSSSLPELARYFVKLRAENFSWEYLSKRINNGINSGAISPTVAQVFLSVFNHEHAIAAALRQGRSAFVRQVAMKYFKKKCQSERFFNMWTAVGGIAGLMALMSTMSVHEVSLLCRHIGECTSTTKPIDGNREVCFTELIKAFRNTNGDNPWLPKNPDTRPLNFYYNKILPACEPSMVFEEISKNTKIEKIEKVAYRANKQGYVANFNAAILPPNGTGKKITPYKFVLDGNDIQFSLNVLMGLLLNFDSLKLNAENLIQDLVHPLARRLCNRREEESVQVFFYSAFIHCLKIVPSIANTLDYSIVTYAVKAWSHAHEIQEHMKRLLGMLVQLMTDDYQWTLDRIANELQHVKPSLRPELLSLLLENAKPFEVNIDLTSNVDCEALRSLGKAWPLRIFYLLPSDISLLLYGLLRTIYPNSNFIRKDYSAGTDMKRIIYDLQQCADPDMLLALLHARNHRINPSNLAWPAEMQSALQQQKYKATYKQDKEGIASCVQSAIILSIASGSLFLYEDTMLWARQFGRFPLVAQRLLSIDILLAQEGLDILSGISRPLPQNDNFLLAQLKENVERANRILIQYMEMLSSYLESSSGFLLGVFNVVLLPSAVIQRRVERLRAFKEGAGLSDDEIYHSVWEPSISMLLDAERFLLEKGDKYPLLNKIRGPLRHISHLNQPEFHVRKFLDKLGESRDKLWQEYRLEIYPVASHLEAPWPRGLPIQDLVPHKLSNWKDMPYVESRAKAILFAPGTTLQSPIPVDTEERTAIGPFVDDFIFALSIFVSAVDEGPERESRVLRVWNHAVANFTINHKSKTQVLWYWKHFFSLAPGVKLPRPVAAQFEVSNFKLPENDRSGVIIEWNPNLTLVQLSRMSNIIQHSEKLPRSCLDCMLMAHKTKSPKTVYSPFQLYGIRTIKARKTPFVLDVWNSTSSLPPQTIDYFVATTIAFLDRMYGSNSSLLERPLPSEKDDRFPAIRLDENILKEQGNLVKLNSVLRILERLSLYIPVLLFRALARSIWKRFSAEKNNPDVLKAALGVSKILLRGDNPDAAYEFIIQGILDHQDDDLWHDCLLNTSILRRLPTHGVRDLLHSFCSSINNKLRMQQRAITLRARKNKPPAPPLVKITTIKLASRLLCETNYVDQRFACETLARLLKNSTDADARITIVESLLSIKSATEREEVLFAIINIIEEHAVPIAASINERQPPTEAEWVKAEVEEGHLPEVYENNPTLDLPPMLKLLVEAIPPPSTGKDNVNQLLHDTWMRRIIIPTLKRSATNHQRWTALFLKRNGFILSVHDLPIVPSNPKLLADLFKAYPKAFPSSTFDAIKDVVKINIFPDTKIAIVNETVRNNPKLLQSNAGKHWLSVWSTTENPLSLGVFQFADLMLDRTMNASSEGLGGATIEIIHSFMVNIAKTYMCVSDMPDCNTFINELAFHRRICSPETHGFFKLSCIPLLEDLITHILSLQIYDWQQDEIRQPWGLTDVLAVKLQILKGKHWHEASETPSSADIREFAMDVITLV